MQLLLVVNQVGVYSDARDNPHSPILNIVNKCLKCGHVLKHRAYDSRTFDYTEHFRRDCEEDAKSVEAHVCGQT